MYKKKVIVLHFIASNERKLSSPVDTSEEKTELWKKLTTE